MVDWYEPGFRAGGPITSCVNLVNGLKGEFDIKVITTDTDYGETTPYSAVKSDQWNLLEESVSVYYCSKLNLNRRKIKELLTETVYDWLHLNSMFSRYFTIMPFMLMKGKKKIVLAPRGMLAKGALAIKPFKKRFFLAWIKAAGITKHVIFHATSEQEHTDIKRKFGVNALTILSPNFPISAKWLKQLKRSKEKGKIKLIYLARISPEKNQLYAIERLMKLSGGVEVDLYGLVDNENYWRDCQRRIRDLPATIDVKYKGMISHPEIKELFKDYHFLYMPSVSENYGHVVIEAMATGCGVIISDQTPWTNLVKGAGWALNLSEITIVESKLQEAIDMDQEAYDLYSDNAYERASAIINDPELLAKAKELFQ